MIPYSRLPPLNSLFFSPDGVRTAIMRNLLLAGTAAFVVAAAIAACSDQEIAGPGSDLTPVAGLPTASANANCSFTPSGEISIPVNGVRLFNPSNAADCLNAYGEITQGSAGSAGFNAQPCTDLQHVAANSAFRVVKCTTGPASLKIYTNVSKTTLLQTVGIDLIP